MEMDNKLSGLSLIGADCRVRDPKSGYEFDLSSLKGRDYSLNATKYTYYLSICGGLQTAVCKQKKTGGETVSSCQVAGERHKIAGMERKNFLYSVMFNLCNFYSTHVFEFSLM